MVQIVGVHCPLCQIPMVVKALKNRTHPRDRKSLLYCQSCGHGLKDAFKARLLEQAELPDAKIK